MTLPRISKPESPVIRVLYDFRAAMDNMDEALMNRMGKEWLEIERKLDADITALAYEMERRAAAGEVITEQMVWRMERYQSLKAQMQAEIKKYNQWAGGTISTAQEQFATLGISASNEAITASYISSPLSRSWTKINVKAVESMIGFAGDGSPLSALLKADYGDAADGLMNALINGLARGKGAAQIAADMRDGFGMGYDRSLLIARTEAARAYRTASTEQYRQSGVVTGFRRLVKKAGACAACLFLDGETFAIETELDEHPRGRCMLLAIISGVGSPTWQTGPQWFMLQPPEKQSAILGPERYNMWKSGVIKLSDIPGKTHSDVWGDSPRVKTVKELKR